MTIDLKIKNSAQLDDIVDALSRIDGALCDGERSGIPSHWGALQSTGAVPRSIMRPSEWAGGEILSVACTQTSLAARDQKKLVDQWCEALAGMTSVRTLLFTTKVPQDLFDAACAMKSLKALQLKWNSIKDLSRLAEATSLRCLNLGQSSSVESLEPVAGCAGLEWFQIESPTKAFSLTPLAGMSQLIGLGFLGQEGKKLTVPSLDALSGLASLRWLHLGSVHVADDSLRPLAKLRHLEWLGLGNHFETEEFAWLSTQLADTICDWLKPYARFNRSLFPCRRCATHYRVMTSGRGSQLLCPCCDRLKLAKQVLRFNSATV